VAPIRVDIMGVSVDAQTLPEAVDRISGWIECGHPDYVCVTGVHGLMACQDDPDLLRMHNEAGMVTTDGMPLVWLSRRRAPAGAAVDRVYGPDLMDTAFARSETTGWRHFLFGASADTLDRLQARLGVRYPRARIAGTLSPPFGPIDAAEDARITRAISATRPDIVWVGLSTPKQERWMAAHVGRLDAPVLIGVGAAFDFHAGVKRQAPRWVQHAGLEWGFRLVSEPRRLGRRYLSNNTRFLWAMAGRTLSARAVAIRRFSSRALVSQSDSNNWRGRRLVQE
jgi:N-acetylglucosaminyldiphosphoundecaprenol N-acetyl-beta-D-mannosaminyltransferase